MRGGKELCFSFLFCCINSGAQIFWNSRVTFSVCDISHARSTFLQLHLTLSVLYCFTSASVHSTSWFASPVNVHMCYMYYCAREYTQEVVRHFISNLTLLSHYRNGNLTTDFILSQQIA